MKRPLVSLLVLSLAGALSGCPWPGQTLMINSIYIADQSLAVRGRTTITIEATTLPGRTLRYLVQAERGRVEPAVYTTEKQLTYYAPYASRGPDPTGNLIAGDRLIIRVLDDFNSAEQSATVNLTGNTIAYVKDAGDSNGQGEIWLATVDESGFSVTGAPQPLKNRQGQPIIGAQPVVSPDGRRVAYTHWPGTGASGIFTVDAAGNVLNLTGVSAENGRNVDPTWAPTGRELAFASDRRGNFDIYRVSVEREGNVPIQVSSTGVHERYPAWNPSFNPDRVSTLAVSAQMNTMSDINSPSTSSAWNVFMMDLASGNYRRQITNRSQPGEFAVEPRWRPDGAALAYTHFGPIGNENTTSLKVQRIFIQDINLNAGAGQAINYNTETSESVAESSPVWSPNGNEIAYLRVVNGLNGQVFRQRVFGIQSSVDAPRLWNDFTVPIPTVRWDGTNNRPIGGAALTWR